ncbi:hypothetical protein Godav_026682 [Gossypium davidsonii]|uniref:Uncharacterized protein n=1 Tax=Gossypium davidsonii TaxID=34287 RepID=A0A7J8RTP9_GOSDV|nr:hypothetical protein [Gossypium davidsonii]
MCPRASIGVGFGNHDCRGRRRCFISYQNLQKKGMIYRRFVLSLKTVNG